MMNIYQKLAVATAGAALSFTMIEANPVEAAIVSRNFTVSNFSRPGIGIPDGSPLSPGNLYTGSFSYDDALLTGSGLESIAISQLNFDFLGTIYRASDDVGYPEFPKVEFFGGDIYGLNYVINKPGFAAAFFGNKMDFGLSSFADAGRPPSGGYYVSDVTGLYISNVTYSPATTTSVPEPSTVVGLAVLGLGSLLLKKKEASSQKANPPVEVVN